MFRPKYKCPPTPHAGFGRQSPENTPADQRNSAVAANRVSRYSIRDIAGTVASMTEGDPGVASEKASDNPLG